MRSFLLKTCWQPTRRLRSGGVFSASVLVERPGFISLLVEGKGAKQAFKDERGGHRWQRKSPTEKRGRVHTSTVTVAVLDPLDLSCYRLDERDVEFVMTRGTGPGGQHRNKTDSCVVATHRATGISVRIDSRSQHSNKKIALRILAERLSEKERKENSAKRSRLRKEQVGSGMRGDKIRTYRQRDDRVVDHVTGKKWKLTKWMRGDW